MCARICTIFLLILALLFGGQLPVPRAPEVAKKKLPGCGMTICVLPCCSSMPCCLEQAEKTPHPEPTSAPSSPNRGVDWAAMELRAVVFQYEVPRAENPHAGRQMAVAAQQRSRRVVSCIFLI